MNEAPKAGMDMYTATGRKTKSDEMATYGVAAPRRALASRQTRPTSKSFGAPSGPCQLATAAGALMFGTGRGTVLAFGPSPAAVSP